MTPTTVHVIAHSHWDREWYLPFERHRLRLVALMDSLIALLEQDPEFHSFHLDGQTIILDDYLALRPEMRERIVALVRAGRLQIGPWYILQDAFLTSGEANVRNLLVGHRDAAAFGPVCKLGYFPDTFGNIGQAPQLMRQAGIDNAVFGRGVRPVGFNNTTLGAYESPFSEMRWQAPDGSTVLGILFANWYDNGLEIPSDPEAAGRYWPPRLAAARRFAATPHLLFMNGCDHQPVQADLSAAMRTARERFPELAFVQTDFPTYLARVKDALPEQLTTVHGELRSQRTDGWWTLVNTASARLYLKQANQQCQTMLEQVAEPLATFAALHGQPYPHHLFTHAWKTLMQNHPHDSICGCSVDEIHREMLTRFASSQEVAAGIAEASARALVGRIDTTGFAAHDPAALPFVVFNTTGWARSGAASIELDLRRAPLGGDRVERIAELQALPSDGYGVIDPAGNPVAATVEDLGVQFGYELPDDRFRQRHLARRLRVTLHADAVPALGYRCYALARTRAPSTDFTDFRSAIRSDGLEIGVIGGHNGPAAEAPEPAPLPHGRLENAFLAVTIAADGALTVLDKGTGRSYSDLCVYEDVGDIGNEYLFRQPDGDRPRTTRGLPATVTLEEHSAVRTVYRIVHSWRLPASADATLAREQRELVPVPERTAQRGAQLIEQTITTLVTLEAGLPQLTIETRLNNQARDHRLRALFPSGCASPEHRAASVFEVAVRPNEPAPEWRNPSNCQHQQAFVTIGDAAGGLTIANQGLPEYELLRDGRGTIALTLLRAVGELGDWGVFPTPEAQCLGEQRLRFAIIPHGPGAARAASYAAAYQFQAPWVARQAPLQAGSLPPEQQFIRWDGPGLALTAVKLAEDGDDLILRWFNTSPEPAALTVAAPGVEQWRQSDILEGAGAALEPEQSRPVRGAEIVTLRGRLAGNPASA